MLIAGFYYMNTCSLYFFGRNKIVESQIDPIFQLSFYILAWAWQMALKVVKLYFKIDIYIWFWHRFVWIVWTSEPHLMGLNCDKTAFKKSQKGATNRYI